METAVLSSVIKALAPKIFSFLQGNHELRRGLELDIHYIRNELGMIAAAIEDHHQRSWKGGTNDAEKFWIQGVRDMSYRIEDCIDRFLHRVSLEPGASSFRRKTKRLTTTSTRTEFASEIRKLRKVSEEAFKLKKQYIHGVQTSTSEASAPTFSPSEVHIPSADLVGMERPRDELIELIREDEGQPKQLKVISIVGFGGIGKTVLARQVYNSAIISEQYEPRIWVRASEKGAGDVLNEILQKVNVGVQVQDGHCDALIECLRSKRFFIVIDDMQSEYWNTIKNAFPKNASVSSRMLVTTAIQSIANACSADNGHVYLMRTLDQEHSRQLFLREASLDFYAPAEQVLKKCDGLPLALVTTAQLLQSKGHLTPTGCANLCRYMGEHMEKEETLARLRHVLLQNYISLPGHVLKACLLYLGIFPSDRPIRRKCLIRRWLAEGFVEADHRRSAPVVALDNFKELMNRSIIKPVEWSNNMNAKTCQAHGMVLEFILQKSMSENFITLLHDQADHQEKVRRLSLHHDSAERIRMHSIDLSLVRSLTIFGEADRHVLKFSKCKLLRVLDLEDCKDLNDEHMKNICNLLLLRYLSLGGNITTLPKEISKLKFLETLDIRSAKAKFVRIPIEAIKLPCLIHLLGLLMLPDVGQKEMRNLQIFLSENSNLETLAGFVANQSGAFPQLISHMNSLTKVKVWFKPTGDGSNSFGHLSSPIQEFIQRGDNVNKSRSLTLSFEGCSQDFLDFPLKQNSCYLSSLKLHGELCRLPPFVTNLGCVTELCLSSPDQMSGDVLAALKNVSALHYLKLIARQLDRFFIENGALKNLRCLFIVVASMTCLENQDGALPQLESLWLLCKDLNGLSGVQIERLGRLKEVNLQDGVNDETMKEWKEAANKHPKRPRISFVKTKEFDQTRMEVGVVGEPVQISESTAAPTSEAGDIKMQVHRKSEYPVVQKGHARMLSGLFSSRKPNGGALASVSRAANKQDGISN